MRKILNHRHQSPGSRNRSTYIRRHISTSGNVAEHAQLKSMKNSFLRGDNKLYVILTYSLQNHSSPDTTVLIDYKRRHISTSGLVQNAAKCAQLESVGKNLYDHRSLMTVHISFLLYSVESPGRSNRWIYIYIHCHISTSGNTSPNVHSLSQWRILLFVMTV